jgi:hypothetical protein
MSIRAARVGPERGRGDRTRHLGGMAPVPALLGRFQARLLLDVGGDQQVVAVAAQVAHAEGQRAAMLLAALALFGVGVAQRQLALVVVLAGDEVHHAAHGVGAVHGRGAVTQHLDALDGGEGDAVQVHRDRAADGAEGVAGQTPTVEQHQGAVGTQAAQVGVAGGVAGALRGVGQHPGHGRDAAQDVLDVGGAALLDLVAADDADRHGGLGRQALDGRAGDDDALERLLRRLLLGHGRQRTDAGAGQGQRQAGGAVMLGRNLERV